MRRWLIVALMLALLGVPTGCSAGRTPRAPTQQAVSGSGSWEPEAEQAEPAVSSERPREEEETDVTPRQFYITAGDTTFTAVFADNSSGEALEELLAQGDLTLSMSDYGNFEKVGSLGIQLPQNNEQITTGPGDVILYQGSSITIYYDTNTWNFTRLGTIQDVTREDLLAALGEGDVEVTFSLTGPEQ